MLFRSGSPFASFGSTFRSSCPVYSRYFSLLLFLNGEGEGERGREGRMGRNEGSRKRTMKGGEIPCLMELIRSPRTSRAGGGGRAAGLPAVGGGGAPAVFCTGGGGGGGGAGPPPDGGGGGVAAGCYLMINKTE